MKDIGRKLQTARQRAGFDSVAQASRETGIPYMTLHNYETERSYPGSEMLRKLCLHYKISADDLLGLSQ